ncbi:MAG: hypothetical protein GDA48_26235 [Hormoscilla sp. GM102CHS1]|nr:hypothetical protein [Hormoscilla sp. GM102CHS1]
MYGGEGDDTLIGGPGRDELYGGEGKDVFVLDWSATSVIGVLNIYEGDKIRLAPHLLQPHIGYEFAVVRREVRRCT